MAREAEAERERRAKSPAFPAQFMTTVQEAIAVLSRHSASNIAWRWSRDGRRGPAAVTPDRQVSTVDDSGDQAGDASGLPFSTT
jgi:hypothetical protein